jgi:alcohol dehydrogenase
MKAARLYEVGKPLKVEEVTDPTLRSGSAIVKVLCAHVFSYTREVINGERGYALPELPFTPGTGAIGIVEAIADDVFGLEIGQKVFCDPYIYSQNISAEPDGILLGWTGLAQASPRLQSIWKDGVFAEKVLFPADCLTPIPEAIAFSPEQLIYLDYLTVVYGGLLRADLRPAQTLVINGATGGLGSSAVLLALAMGVAKIIAVGRSKEALKALEQIDKRVVGVAVDGDVNSDAEKIREVTNGGADVAIDLLGDLPKPEQTLTVINALRRGGTAVFVGGVSADIPLPYPKIMLEQLIIKGSFMYPKHAASKLVTMIDAGILNLDIVKPHVFSLNEIEIAIEKAPSFKGFNYCVIVPNRN